MYRHTAKLLRDRFDLDTRTGLPSSSHNDAEMPIKMGKRLSEIIVSAANSLLQLTFPLLEAKLLAWDQMKSGVRIELEQVENALDVPPRRPKEVPSLHKWKTYDFSVIPRTVVREEINEFSLQHLASDLYWYFAEVGSTGIEQALSVLRQLVEEVRIEASLADGPRK